MTEPGKPVKEQTRVGCQDLIARAKEREVFEIPEVVIEVYHSRRVNLDWNQKRKEANSLAAVLMQALPREETRKRFAAILQIEDIIHEKARLVVFAYGFEEVYELAASEEVYESAAGKVDLPPLASSLKTILDGIHYDCLTQKTLKAIRRESGAMLSPGQVENIFALSAWVEGHYEEFYELEDKLREELANDRTWLATWDYKLYPLLTDAFLICEAPVFYNEGRKAAFSVVFHEVFHQAFNHFSKIISIKSDQEKLGAKKDD